jgi:hypothetical protein
VRSGAAEDRRVAGNGDAIPNGQFNMRGTGVSPARVGNV